MFVERDQFLTEIERDGFLEWAEFLGNLYGTPVPRPPTGTDTLLEIEVQGARQVHEHDPDALLLFLVPPSVAEQERRLRARGDTDHKVRQRLEKAPEEVSAAASLGAIEVVNDDLDRAVDEIVALIHVARSARGVAT